MSAEQEPKTVDFRIVSSQEEEPPFTLEDALKDRGIDLKSLTPEEIGRMGAYFDHAWISQDLGLFGRIQNYLADQSVSVLELIDHEASVNARKDPGDVNTGKMSGINEFSSIVDEFAPDLFIDEVNDRRSTVRDEEIKFQKFRGNQQW